MSKKLRTFLPKAKIKQMMQRDEDVGKIAADVPVMISRALELFLIQLVSQAHNIASQRGSKMLNAQHV
jgi:Dr1-associated corepressor